MRSDDSIPYKGTYLRLHEAGMKSSKLCMHQVKIGHIKELFTKTLYACIYCMCSFCNGPEEKADRDMNYL